MVTRSNNSFMENKFMQILNLLPKSIKRIIGIKLEIIPFYLMCCDNDNIISAHELIKKIYVYIVIFIFFVVGFIFSQSYCIISFVTSKQSRYVFKNL